MGLCQDLWWCPRLEYSQGSWESWPGCPRHQRACPAPCRLPQQESWQTPSPSGMGVEYVALTFHGLGRTMPFDRFCNWTAGPNPHHVCWRGWPWWCDRRRGGPDSWLNWVVPMKIWNDQLNHHPGTCSRLWVGPPKYQLHLWHPEKKNEGKGPKEPLPRDLHDLG